MPVHTTTSAGHPAKQWGEHGHKYPFTAGNPQSRARATEQAEAQGRAARAHGYTDEKPANFREG
jgi:hypothetical protein